MESVCPFFLRGSCHFGRRCWYSHVVQGAPNQHHDEETTFAAPPTIETVSTPVHLPATSSNAPRVMPVHRRMASPTSSRSDDRDMTLPTLNVERPVLAAAFEIPLSLRSAQRIVRQKPLPHPASSRSADLGTLSTHTIRTASTRVQLRAISRNAPRVTQGRETNPASPRSADEETTLPEPPTVATVSTPVQLPATSSNAPRIIPTHEQMASPTSPRSDDEDMTLPARLNDERTVLAAAFQIPSSLRSAQRVIRQRRLPHPSISRSVVNLEALPAPTIGTVSTPPVQLPAISSNTPRVVSGSVQNPSSSRTVDFPVNADTRFKDTSSDTVINTASTRPRDDNDALHEIDQCVRNELICHICQDIYTKPTVINCSHTFCFQCIYTWTTQVRQCPLCRETVTNMAHCRSLDAFLAKIIKHLPEETK